LKIKHPRLPATEIYRIMTSEDIARTNISLSIVNRIVNRIEVAFTFFIKILPKHLWILETSKFVL